MTKTINKYSIRLVTLPTPPPFFREIIKQRQCIYHDIALLLLLPRRRSMTPDRHQGEVEGGGA